MHGIVMLNHKCWATIGNTNLDDGRGGSYVIAFAKDRNIAINAGKNKYVMGTDCPIYECCVDVIVPDGDWDRAYVPKYQIHYQEVKTVGTPYLSK